MTVAQRLRRLSHWLLPRACALCGATTTGVADFCGGCTAALPRLGPCCVRCAAPFPDAGPIPCGQCQQEPPYFHHVDAPFRYAPPLDQLILGAKYGGRLDWIAALGRCLRDAVQPRTGGVDLLLPVPLHRARLRERGYNQSVELARPLAKAFGLPLSLAVERVRATSAQAGLPRDLRARNLRNAFAARADFTGARVAIIDDVLTSGATADALARCLTRAGAVHVEVWVVART